MHRTHAVIGSLALLLAPAFASAQSFPDVPNDHDNLRAILALQSTGLFSGYPDGTFRPDRTINRAEMLKILVTSLGSDSPIPNAESCFPDVSAADWYSPYVCMAAEQGWVSGYPDGYFRPDHQVNLAEAMKMLVTVRQYELSKDRYPAFDLERGQWFTPYMDTLLAKDAISAETLWGNDPDDGLDKPLTRKRAAEILYRAMLDDGRIESYMSGDCEVDTVTSVSLRRFDTNQYADGTVLVDFAIIGEMKNGESCTLAERANPYGNASKHWNSIVLFPIAGPTSEGILEQAPVVDGKVYFRKGHETAGLGDDVWMLNFADLRLSLVSSVR